MKSESRKKTIKLRSVNAALFGYFCLLSIILILLVDVVFYIIVSVTLENQARDRVNDVGVDIIRQAERMNRPDMLEPSFRRYRDEGIDVYIFSTEGEVIVTEAAGIDESRINDVISRLGYAEADNNVTYRSGGAINFAARITFQGGEEGLLLVTYPLAIVRKTVATMQLYLLLISLVVLLLALLISYNISSKLSRTVKSISDSALQLAKGDYSVQFVNADYREVAQLSDTLNYVRDEVKKSRDFQREILANVTHDLKTPLTMIKAYASMVQEISGDNPEKRNKHLQVIIDEADRLTGLVNDVLSVSKVTSNLGELNPKVFNLTEYLYGIINKFGYLKQSGYNLMVDIDSNLYTRADEEKIGQVIYNLLSNAVSYTGEDKTVYISLKSSMDGKRIKLSVRDTGKGISREELSQIWDRYYRAEDNHTRPVKGTGLGLNIVKVILENHSFDFGVESGRGEGSTFWVDFPLVPSEPAPANRV